MSPAAFEVQSEEIEGGVSAFSVRGELDMSTAPGLEGPLEEALASNVAAVMIDLSDCEFIDSTGIAVIVNAWQRLDRGANAGGEGRLVLCCVNDQVQRLLEITGVGSSIPIHGQREAALADLRG